MLKLWIEADALLDYMGNDPDPSPSTVVELVDRFCDYAHSFFGSLRNPSSERVTLYISVDTLTKVQENILLEEHRQDFQNDIESDVGSVFNIRPKIEVTESTEINVEIVSYCADHINRYLELRQNIELPVNDRTRTLLRNSACLLQSDCEAVITRTYAGDYTNILWNRGVSVLSLSRDFNLDTIKNARYEWIERHLTSLDPPNLALANQMTFEVTRRFAGDIDERYLDLSNWDADLFRKLPCSVITRINDLWQNHLRQQQNIFQKISGDYDQFRGRVSWYQDNHYLSAEELYALAIEPNCPHLPCIFHFIDNLKQRESLDKAWLIRLATCFKHSGL